MKITDARVGQRVRIIDDQTHDKRWVGTLGTIVSIGGASIMVEHDSDGSRGSWTPANLEQIYDRFEALRKIDFALNEYAGQFGRDGLHDLRLLGFVQGVIDRPEFNPDYSEAQAFEILAEAVNLNDDIRWAEAAWQHESDTVDTAAVEQGLLRQNPDEYALHFGVVGFATLPEADHRRLADALRINGARFFGEGDRFAVAEWGEYGLLEGEDVTRVADRAGHFLVHAPGYTDPGIIWNTIVRNLPGMVFLTPEQIAQTGGTMPTQPYVTSTVEDWSKIIEIY